MSDTPSELEKLRAELAATKAELVQVRAVVSSSEALISALKLEIAKLKREQYGTRSERSARLIDQLELQLEELEATATEDEIMAEKAIATAPNPPPNDRRRPSRKPFPEHLPRERVVIEAPAACTCCGSARIVKMGEDVTETLEVIPRQWKVIQTAKTRGGGRSSPAVLARRSVSHPRPSIPPRADGPGRICWR